MLVIVTIDGRRLTNSSNPRSNTVGEDELTGGEENEKVQAWSGCFIYTSAVGVLHEDMVNSQLVAGRLLQH
jgi:hypothetical protein